MSASPAEGLLLILLWRSSDLSGRARRGYSAGHDDGSADCFGRSAQDGADGAGTRCLTAQFAKSRMRAGW